GHVGVSGRARTRAWRQCRFSRLDRLDSPLHRARRPAAEPAEVARRSRRLARGSNSVPAAWDEPVRCGPLVVGVEDRRTSLSNRGKFAYSPRAARPRAFLRVRGIQRVRLHADLVMLRRLSPALARARAVPLAT